MQKNMNIQNIVFDVEKINISKESLACLMGYAKGNYPQPVHLALDEFFRSMPRYVRPQGGFKVFARIQMEENGFRCHDLFFNTGKIIASYLKDAEYLSFFIVTAGPKLDMWSRASRKSGDLLLSYTVDCAGSEIANALADKIGEIIAAHFKDNGCLVTNHYSPGYCGWNVDEQKKLFSLLPDNFCGVQLMESSLMIPIKSVSGVIGIGKKVKKQDYQCATCNQTNCLKLRLKSKRPPA